MIRAMFTPTRALTRGLRTTAVRSSGATEHGNDPKTLEKEKNKSLKGENDEHSSPIDHAPGWNQHLASKPEAEVKADKVNASPEELQKETAAKANQS